MRATRFHAIRRGLSGLVVLAAVTAAMALPPTRAHSEPATEFAATLQKANLYIELAKTTERGEESWERYASWVNLKTGPTGKEQYISYGLYELSDVDGLGTEVRAVAGAPPSTGPLDGAVLRLLESYEALRPVVNEAAGYYDSEGYKADKVALGKSLHTRMVPLFTSLKSERSAMLPLLRAFVRDVEGRELVVLEAQEGRTAAWHVGQVLHAANRVFDLFPRERPQPIDSEVLDQMIKDIGPETSGEKFEQIMSGVEPPKNTVIDVERFRAALTSYAAAVDTFDSYKGEKPDDFDDLKPLPRKLLDQLRAFEGPLAKSQGREFEGGGAMVGQIVQGYFDMFNAGNGLAASRLRYLP